MKYFATFDMIEFVRPDWFCGPYSIEQAFGVLAWMLETGDQEKYDTKGRWGTMSIRCLLSKKMSCVNFYEIDPIISIGDLRSRFHYAILGHATALLERWRKDYGVFVGGRAKIHFPHYKPFKWKDSEANIKSRLDGLLGAAGRLKAQLNSEHKRAKEIYGVRLHRSVSGWRFVLNYGFGGSVWYHELAKQGRREPFLDAFERAEIEMSRLVEVGE